MTYLLSEMIRTYTTGQQNKGQQTGFFDKEIDDLLQKKIHTEMLLNGEMLIKDKQICLKTNSHIGNCNFYLFENGTCMLGTSEYKFKKVDLSSHKDYNNYVTKLSKTININNINLEKLKLYLLSNYKYIFPKMQYLSATNNEIIKDYAIYDYKNILEEIYAIYDDDDSTGFCNNAIVFSNKISQILNKYNFFTLTTEKIKYFDLYCLEIFHSSVPHAFLSNALQYSFNEENLKTFIKIDNVPDLMTWLEISEFQKAKLKQAFQETKLTTNLQQTLREYIGDIQLSPHHKEFCRNYFLCTKEYQKIQEFFRTNPFYTKLAKDLKFI